MAKRPDIDELVDDILEDSEPVAEIEVYEGDDEIMEDLEEITREEKIEAMSNFLNLIKGDDVDPEEALDALENIISTIL